MFTGERRLTELKISSIDLGLDMFKRKFYMNYHPWVIIKMHAEQLTGRIAFIWVCPDAERYNTQCAHLHNSSAAPAL